MTEQQAATLIQQNDVFLLWLSQVVPSALVLASGWAGLYLGRLVRL